MLRLGLLLGGKDLDKISGEDDFLVDLVEREADYIHTRQHHQANVHDAQDYEQVLAGQARLSDVGLHHGGYVGQQGLEVVVFDGD